MQSQQQWMVMGIICASLVHIFMAVESFPIADRITSLPGQPQVSFQQFSGYVTVDEKQQRSLFYYFVEAETQPASKPLALWLNGGPGCSSIGAGAFVEHGPFRPNGDSGNLVKNEYSWNREANMLYLESPAGVGFSYSANASFYTHVNDTITAQDNLIFLQNWFAKFPEYQDNDFFITGESYAGHYVPQLAQLIIQSGLKFNLKGINSWNPLLELGIDFNSGDQYYWSHGVISDATYALLNRVCNSSEMFREAIRGTISPACAFVNIQVSKELTDFIDKYNVNGDVCISNGQPQMGFLYQPFRSRFQTLSSPHSESNPPTQQQSNENEDVCAIENTIKYLNRKDVQKALHAQVVGFDVHWSICRSGDQDSVIPFIRTWTLINKSAKELGLNTTMPYRAWFEGKQVGGWTKVHELLYFSFHFSKALPVPPSPPPWPKGNSTKVVFVTTTRTKLNLEITA
ncbi:hypothetical protein SO802_032052 [Lithocarpus litseifolius]|uniref:Carboxypeptidase n=1 Tax=Lithocarpus litseifolius TaxID=425828 RepID=A0AAW2BP44_9ROSI